MKSENVTIKKEYCPNCFNAIGSMRPCPYCGNEQFDRKNPLALPVNVVLKNRYVVGRMLGAGGFGITYKCYDLKERKICAIKEYAPSTSATRLSDSLTLTATSVSRQEIFEHGREKFLGEAATLSQLQDIPEKVAKKAKLMVVSYPNNPTTAMAPAQFYQDLVAFAKKYDIIVLHDNAYSELVFDGKTCGSFLSYPGAKEIGVEFNSLSKTYGLAGARIGFCLGNKEVVKHMKMLKSNMDYGMFLPIQAAAVAALTGDQDCVYDTMKAYEARRDILCDGFRSIGWEMDRPVATMFVWAPIPKQYESSEAFVMDLVEKTGVMVTPGSAFGPSGEGFVRMALVQDREALERAIHAVDESGIFSKENA